MAKTKIDEFMENTVENFDFSQHDLNCMREAFGKCELIVEGGCMAALMTYGEILYVYYFSISERRQGKGQQFMMKVVERYSPRIVSMVTCHPAMVKIANKIAGKMAYAHTADEQIVNVIVKRLEEDEGKINMKFHDEGVVLKNFYGGYIPQKNRDFNFPEILEEGDALLIILKKEKKY